MTRRPIISPQRAVEVYEEALSVRSAYCADDEFFKMTDFWEYVCDESETWKIKTYSSGISEDFARKAGVIAFDDRVTLTVDEKLWADANKGKWFYNFMLAHEAGHLMLDHHAKGAVTKHFQLFGVDGTRNSPPTAEELETNYAAVFLQCGKALADETLGDLQLAGKAYSDPLYIAKARMAIRLDAFQAILNRPKQKVETVVL